MIPRNLENLIQEPVILFVNEMRMKHNFLLGNTILLRMQAGYITFPPPPPHIGPKHSRNWSEGVVAGVDIVAPLSKFSSNVPMHHTCVTTYRASPPLSPLSPAVGISIRCCFVRF